VASDARTDCQGTALAVGDDEQGALPADESADQQPYLGQKFTECEQWRSDFMAWLETKRPGLIELDIARRYGADFGFTSYDRAWLDGLTRLIQRLRNGDKRFGAGPSAGSALDGSDVCVGAYGQCDRVLAREVGRADDAGIAAVIVGNTLVFRNDKHVTIE
jgi:hypothetical protein